MTWVRCFSLFMAVLAKKSPHMVPSMVAHLHTVMRLQQRSPQQFSWLEYDIHFRMEIAASATRTWTCGDPWQYVSCLPGPGPSSDPFDLPDWDPPTSSERGKGPLIPKSGTGEKRPALSSKPPAKKPRRETCRLFNIAPGGCPYGEECIFLHRCSNCGAENQHQRRECPVPPKPGNA